MARQQIAGQPIAGQFMTRQELTRQELARPRPGDRRRRGHRARRFLKIFAFLATGATAVTVGAGLYGYQRLSNNIHSVPLLAGVQGDAGKEKVDPFGHSPINVLVIGSDARSTAADCKLGHDCGSGANADVELVVHIAADRTNATVMSIPRDTMTQLPACRNTRSGQTLTPHYGQINGTLYYGPGCTVAAVHDLTGIPIDHFAMVDFSGVVTMSDAVGGVSVCVSNNVFDPYSHLKLSKGVHTLKGLAALEFVRSRHGFGDGSDLGRTYAQHIFLSSMIRRLKSTGVITNPGDLLGLADAATKALTVDSGLAGIPQLLGLAADLNKVPSDRITFATMQNRPDPANPARVVASPAARRLFDVISNDQSLTTSTGARSAASPASPSPTTSTQPMDGAVTAAPASLAGLAVVVQNGSGLTGRASMIAKSLIAHGFSPGTTFVTAATRARSTLRYGPGRQAQAKALAGYLHLPAAALEPGKGRGITLTVGTDWVSGVTFTGVPLGPAAGAVSGAGTDGAGTAGAGTAGATATAAATAARAALADSHAQTANQSGTCAPVSLARTVAIKGVPMTPVRAYAVSAAIPDSAP